MPFVKEERYMGFVSESDAHADKTDLAIETLSDDVSKFLLVGSLGRKEETVGDIDILVIPKSITAINRHNISNPPLSLWESKCSG